MSEQRRDTSDDEGTGVGLTVVASVIALLVGVFVGTITTFVHRQWALDVGPVAIPVGLLVALVLVACLLAGFRIVFGSRVVAAAAAAGVLAACTLLTFPGAGGSVLVVDDPVGWTWAVGPAVLALAVLVWPRIRRPATT